MIVVLAALLASPPLVIRTIEPRAASPWVQSVRATCPAGLIEISGYGPSRPVGRSASIRIGGRPVAGALAPLLADLSGGRAVYRLGILCDRKTGITLRLNKGERQPDGSVRYQSGAASFTNGRLVSYTGLQPSDEDGFWFR